MKWKNKLKAVLVNSAEGEKIAMCPKTILTKTDENRFKVVSSVFVSDELLFNSAKSAKIENVPICSNCGLEMNLIENNTLWFCPFGCGSQKAE